MQHIRVESGEGFRHLSELAERYGSDKGPSKHRYTELYQMLFQPYRNRQIHFMEMGLLVGGPEHGEDVDRETRDLPSIRMWLEFFSEARITGLDVSDFSWFEHDRFNFVRCDMDERANIRDAADQVGPVDIVIDDASHASHHQQYAFLELFPKVTSGGLYIIEDLRWQPQPYEKEGITKTADLFSGFSARRQFDHVDPVMQAAFNGLAPMISGCFVFQAHFTKTRRDQVAVIHKL
ncbi:MAG: hypothetical protein OXQ92_05960 [Boseongicola sp.]|nr:hypothetical protein [Boseongicola sp.]MDD9977347.1 hypothetical protein [Boseongicola sp.]